MLIAERNALLVGGGVTPGPVAFETQFTAVLNSVLTSNKTVGIYSATSINSSVPIVVDWGDGTTDTVRGDISQLTHTYSDYGTYVVGISDNISSFALSANDSTWLQTTTGNYYNVRTIDKISANVTSIPAYGCYSLTVLLSVYAGDSGTLTLGNNAFYTSSTTSKATYDFSGRTIAEIPTSCFNACSYLTYFTFPKGVTSIGISAFRNCWNSGNPGTIEIPEGVTSIGDYAFTGCMYLNGVVIPSTVTTIGQYAFSNCQRLYTMWVNRSTAPTAGWTCFGNGQIGNQYTGYYHQSDGTSRLIVPVGATGYDTGNWSFPLCTYNKCGFTKIEADAVATKFEVETDSSYRKAGIYSAAIIDSTKPIVVDWGDGSTSESTGSISQLVHTYSINQRFTVRISDNISSFALSANDSTWRSTTTSNLNVVRRINTLSSNITSIPSYGFAGLQYIKSVYAGDSGALALGDYAFSSVGNMVGAYASFDFSNRTITTIPQYCFSACQYIGNFVFPIGLNTIGTRAFETAFDSTVGVNAVITIPEGVTTFGNYAFYRCTGLYEITLPSTITTIANGTFGNCSNLGTITAKMMSAPAAGNQTFGDGTAYYNTGYTGRKTYSAGTNRLYVPVGSTGYDTGKWLDPLQDANKCGFTKVEVSA